MELEYITVAELFGNPPSTDKMEALAAELEEFASVRERVFAAAHIKNSQKRAESLAGLYLLSKMADLSRGRLTCESGGKPRLEGGPEFNVSHSGGLAVCVTDSAPVGVDAEMLRSVADKEKLSRRYFSQSEQKRLDLADDPDREFLRIWTKKEAYLKMTGEGLSRNIAMLDTEELALSFEELTVTACGVEYLITVCKQN